VGTSFLIWLPAKFFNLSNALIFIYFGMTYLAEGVVNGYEAPQTEEKEAG